MEADMEARIRAMAYAIWEEEGRPEGKHLEHWAESVRLATVEAKQAMPQITLVTRAPSSAKGLL